MEEPFTPMEQDSWGGLLWAYSRMMDYIETDLQQGFQITHVEFELLLRLNWAEGHRMRIQELAERSVLTRSGISRVVDRLATAGFIVKETAPEDRRGSYAILTAKGSAHFAKALAAHVKIVKKYFLSHFNDTELGQMANFWTRIPNQPQEKEV